MFAKRRCAMFLQELQIATITATKHIIYVTIVESGLRMLTLVESFRIRPNLLFPQLAIFSQRIGVRTIIPILNTAHVVGAFGL